MAHTATIRLEQISRAKKLLQNLPEKEDRKTRSEAAKLLEKDFRKALKKGYSPEELRSLLKNEGIIIPAYLIKQFHQDSGETSDTEKREQSREKTTANAEKCGTAEKSFIIPDTPDTEI